MGNIDCIGTRGDVGDWPCCPCTTEATEVEIGRCGGGGGRFGDTVKLGLEKFCWEGGGVGETRGSWCDLFPSIGEDGMVATSTSAEELRECTS